MYTLLKKGNLKKILLKSKSKQLYIIRSNIYYYRKKSVFKASL